MRTRVVATGSALLLTVFLMGLGPSAGAGQGVTFMVNVQVTPSVDEGGTAHLTGNLDSSCPTAGGVDLAINWNDGSEVETVNEPSVGPFDVAHVYADDDPSGTSSDSHTVSVQATDQCGNVNRGAAETVVHNVDPTITDLGVIRHVVGEFTRIEATFTDPGKPDTFTVTIDWGDGSQNTVRLMPAIQKIREAHRYMTVDQFKISLTVEDDDTGVDADSIIADVPPAPPRIVTGSGKGRPALVKTFESGDKPTEPQFLAYRSSFNGGVRVAVGDVDGDGYDDIITAAGAGGGPLVRVWDGSGEGTLIHGFYPYRSSFTGGVFVAAGDLNGDGYADIITGPGAGGGPHIKVFDGRTGKLVSSFFAFSSSFTGGVRVAVGDVNGDGIPDIIVGAGPGGGPYIKVFSRRGDLLMNSFYAFRSDFLGGVFVAAGDVNGDGRADVIVGADAGGGPLVKAFNFATPDGSVEVIRSFFAYSSSFTGGVRVAAGDLNGDGRADIITGAGAGGGPHIKVFNSSVDGGTLFDFAPYDSSFLGGVYVGFGPVRQAPAP